LHVEAEEKYENSRSRQRETRRVIDFAAVHITVPAIFSMLQMGSAPAAEF
jgi:hypothetical protein